MSGILSDPFHMFAIYAALNALIMLVLGALAVRARMKANVGIGDGGKPELGRRLRAHANNTEYTPVALIMMLGLSSLGSPVWILHAVGLPLTIGRLLHGIGLSRNEGPSTLRLLGMVLTFLAYIVGIVALLWLAIVPALVAS